MAIKTIKTAKFNWYYLTDFAKEELEFLKKNFKFHPLDLKDCAGEIQRTKLDVYKNYLFLVVQLPILDKTNKRIGINQVYFFIGKNYLVTVARERIKPLNNFFYKMANNQRFKDEATLNGTGYLLYMILDALLRISWSVHGHLDSEIRQIEQDLDEGRGKRAVFNVASLRRLILQLTSIIDPQKLVTHTLSRINVGFLSKEMTVYFDDLDDFIEKNSVMINSYRDRVLSLQEINESLISYQTNRIMKILTTFSVALLPLTLLAGIYGMNINLPFANNPNMVWSLFGFLALIVFGIFFILKKIDWI